MSRNVHVSLCVHGQRINQNEVSKSGAITSGLHANSMELHQDAPINIFSTLVRKVHFLCREKEHVRILRKLELKWLIGSAIADRLLRRMRTERALTKS